ncbi:MAG TPA: SulP family inorganic anion transporter [Candidatus Bathyarchaeia archaeon]|nr:SulP family inorganic anion transporter [Candidatus Bathyarchaeia archaeon]
MSSRTGLRGDLAGGLSAGALTIPVSMGYGLLALQPLGEQYVSYGIAAGLFSAIVVLFAAALLRGTPGLIYTPRSVVTLVMAAVVLEGVVRGPGSRAAGGDITRTLTLVFFVVLLCGAFQMLFGALRLGTFIRYIPSPVMAGFQNAVALLIIVAQLDALLGFRGHVPFRALAGSLGEAQPLTLAVGLLTAVVMLRGQKLTKRLPPVILALLVGSAGYYALALLGLGARLGPVVGPLPAALPLPSYFTSFGSLFADPQLWPVLVTLAVGAFSLAIVSSLDFLLCARVMDGLTGERSRGSQELVRIGVANIIASGFGAIPSGVNLGASFANHRAGGRTRLAAAIAGGVVLLATLLLAPAIALVPRVVVAGMLVVVGIQLFDPWSLGHLARIFKGERAHWRAMRLDLFVVLLVAATILVVDPVAGVGMGVGVAVLFFLVRMSRSVVRRTYHGDTVRSRRARAPRLMELLAERGRQIVVFELEGPIFFGTAEGLANRAEAAAGAGARYVILDLKRVNELDSTGARILLQLSDRLKRYGGALLVSHPHESFQVSSVLRDLGVSQALGASALFSDTDAALEWAEDRILLAGGAAEALAGEMEVDRLSVLEGLTEAERGVVRSLLARRTFAAGEVVIKEGSTDRDLFLIAHGTASVRVDLPGGKGQRRVASFSAGTVFGELALLDRQPRSATVTADEDVVCYVLSEEAFHTLGRAHAAIAIKLLTNLGRELSGRLRRANAMISELES